MYRKHTTLLEKIKRPLGKSHAVEAKLLKASINDVGNLSENQSSVHVFGVIYTLRATYAPPMDWPVHLRNVILPIVIGIPVI
jgi:hypothetical protein